MRKPPPMEGGGFRVFIPRAEARPDPRSIAVFVEADEDGLYLDKRPQVDRYRRIFDLLVSKAMDPDGVAAYLRSLIS